MPWFDEARQIADPLPAQRLRLRQGDRLSTFAAVIEDEYGNKPDLTDARVWMRLVPLTPTSDGDVFLGELTIESAVGAQVSYDWQAADTLGFQPGVYDVQIEVQWPSATLSVPTANGASVVEVRSNIASKWFLTDVTGKLIPDGDGGFKRFNPLALEDGTFRLLENGTYLLIEEP